MLKFLAEDLFWSRGFQKGVSRLAIDEGESLGAMQRRTGRYLKEKNGSIKIIAVEPDDASTTGVPSEIHPLQRP